MQENLWDEISEWGAALDSFMKYHSLEERDTFHLSERLYRPVLQESIVRRKKTLMSPREVLRAITPRRKQASVKRKLPIVSKEVSATKTPRKMSGIAVTPRERSSVRKMSEVPTPEETTPRSPRTITPTSPRTPITPREGTTPRRRKLADSFKRISQFGAPSAEEEDNGSSSSGRFGKFLKRFSHMGVSSPREIEVEEEVINEPLQTEEPETDVIDHSQYEEPMEMQVIPEFRNSIPTRVPNLSFSNGFFAHFKS